MLQHQSYDAPETRMESAAPAADLSSPAMSPEPEEQRAHLQLRARGIILLKNNVLSCKGREAGGRQWRGYLALCQEPWQIEALRVCVSTLLPSCWAEE